MKVLVGIPTREREGYLAALLSTLVFQNGGIDFDVFIVDTTMDERKRVIRQEHTARVLRLLDAMGHEVTVDWLPQGSRSEVVAVNRILVEARLRGVDFVFKVDDDHILPPDTLSLLMKDIIAQERFSDHKVLVSGVTPWMIEAYEGAVGPGDVVSYDGGKGSFSYLKKDEGIESVTAMVNHFVRYSGVSYEGSLVLTQLASAANFMLRPDIRILWSDTGLRSMYCDAAWFLQLTELLGYSLFFDLSVNVWHAAAPTGGVRVEGEGLLKPSLEDSTRAKVLYAIAQDLKARVKE
jgi:glycosyltransferase involved in cell wall biosynthesis